MPSRASTAECASRARRAPAARRATASGKARSSTACVPSRARSGATSTRRASRSGFDRLVLVAPPKFLGALRKELHKEVEKLVAEELPKDLSWLNAREIERYFSKVVRERLDVGVAHPIQRGRHDRVAARALAVAVGAHLGLEVCLALPGEPRDLVLAAEVREVAHPAAQGFAFQLPSSSFRIRRRFPCPSPAASRSARRASRSRDPSALHHRKHLVGLAQLLAKEDELVLEEELRLPGDRGDLRIGGVAVRAVARGAQLEPFPKQEKEKGR